MTAELLPGLARPKRGVIGTRQLVLIQTLDIARLTSHPVGLIPETFIAVTGMGPVDSNESGKTSFLAAVALLLGDPEWRVGGNGAAGVAALLFEPVTAGIATGASAATEGYIAGIFADPDRIPESAHTVWMKISSSAPYIQVRHAAGVHLARGIDDRERHATAPQVFRSLAGDVLGGGEFAEVLYGRSPRVLAYVASRGQVRSRPSLLKLDAGTFTPEQIGDSLIALTGRATLFERDEEDRRGLAAKQAELNTHRENDRVFTDKEDKILRQVDAREDLRNLIRSAVRLRSASLARSVIDSHARAESAKYLHERDTKVRSRLANDVEFLAGKRTELGSIKGLQQALDKANDDFERAAGAHEQSLQTDGQLAQKEAGLNEQIDETRRAANGYNLATELSAKDAIAKSELLLEAVGEAKGDLKAATEALGEARQAREQAESGQFGSAGEAIRRLEQENIEATSLVASVRLHASHRHTWEARLAPWQDAILIARDDLASALPLLRDRPGTILISEPSEDPDGSQRDRLILPEGIASAPARAAHFLNSLCSQEATGEPIFHVKDESSGIRIVGEFETPIVGHDDLIAHWDRRVADATRAHGGYLSALKQATAHSDLAKLNAERAQAAERLADLLGKKGVAQQQLSAHRTEVMPLLRGARDTMALALKAANKAVDDYTNSLNEINSKLLQAQSALRERDAAIAKYEAAIRPDDTVLAVWGRGLDAALRELGWPGLEVDEEYDVLIDQAEPPVRSVDGGDIERRSASLLLRTANDKLVEAVARFRVYPEAGGAPPTDVADSVAAYLTSRDNAEGPSADLLASTLGVLTGWLDDFAERDASAHDDVLRGRMQRAQVTEFAEAKCRELEEALGVTQGAIRQRASSALDRISQALDSLNRRAPNGLGARLDYSITPPSAPDKKWVCQVTPRWRRNPAGPMLAYDNVTNTAQEKLFSIHLVLAALLAAPDSRGRALILDELGDSLGSEHRREVLDVIAAVAREHGIMILATCQDAIMTEAGPHCREILYFHYPSKSEALNRPTRMFGFDHLGNRVELTAEALMEGRNLFS
ncbi:hypothetical protein Aph01nite_29230 [Acrocarpospora phusangensis]|uniref:Uncharacterized protein n=1 Tax=Acrocarpospora phusangensis TaxID=1070424 RepID=A0A919QBZ3_9ACTN|nr:hypothetical protein [Acrocarpospora phusangensis]GIH24613.1 hypothetical protein Aph01nite_29230 [Acrocarpospora phusangensis]